MGCAHRQLVLCPLGSGEPLHLSELSAHGQVWGLDLAPR